MALYSILGRQTAGWLLLCAGVACGIGLVFSYRAGPRRYRNVLLFDAALMLLVAGVGALTERFLLLQALWRLFAFLAAPLTAAAVGLLLMLDGIVMYKKEGPGRSTWLPFCSGAALLGTMTLTVLAYRQVVHPPAMLRPVMAFSVLTSFFAAFTFLTMLGYGQLACRMPRDLRCDYIIVHGCGIFGERMTPLLRGRVDKAAELYHRMGGGCKLVLSGGMGPGESISEAEAMRRYLESAGFPMEDVVPEERSSSTRENLLFARELLERDGAKPRYLCVTSDFHAFRTAVYARRLGMDAPCVGSRTALYYRPCAAIREYIALMTDAKWLNLGLLGLWALLVGQDLLALDTLRR